MLGDDGEEVREQLLLVRQKLLVTLGKGTGGTLRGVLSEADADAWLGRL
jgi:hypothetical protein